MSSDNLAIVSTGSALDNAIYNFDRLAQKDGGNFTIVVEGSIDLADPNTGVAKAGLPNDSDLYAINLGTSAGTSLTIIGTSGAGGPGTDRHRRRHR